MTDADRYQWIKRQKALVLSTDGSKWLNVETMEEYHPSHRLDVNGTSFSGTEQLDDLIDKAMMELRDRVEALEAAAKPAESNDPAQPNSSLVEWVAGSLTTGLHSDARAAILAVADWFDQQGLFNTAAKLRMEVG